MIKAPKFIVHKSDCDNFDDDEKLNEVHQPSQNQHFKMPGSKSNIFIVEHTNTKLETQYTLSTSSIWKKFERKFYIQDMTIYIKKKLMASLLLHFNGLLGILGIKEQFYNVSEYIINNTEKEYNIKFLYSTIKVIFSEKISEKNKINKHNEQLICNMYKNKEYYVTDLLEMTFFQFLEIFRMTKFILQLRGFETYFKKTIEELESEGKGKDYIIYFINVLNDYEYIYRSDYKDGKIEIIKMDSDDN